MSPLCALTASGIFLYAYKKTDYARSVKYFWFFLFLAGLAWAMGDILYAVCVLNGMNPVKDILSNVAYFMTTLFLLSAVSIFIYLQLKKWNSLQLLLDAVAISGSSILLIWIIFFSKRPLLMNVILADGFIPFASILIDFAIVTGLFIWFFSIGATRISAYLHFISGGLALFCIADIVYTYLYYNGQYTPNTVIDAVYMASLLTIAIGALGRVRHAEKWAVKTESIKNVGFKHRELILLLFPAAAILSEGFVLRDMLVFALIISVNKGVSTYIEHYVENVELLKQMLDQKTELKDALEQRVMEQTHELALLANQDTVTRLYNRRYFFALFEDAITNRKPAEVLVLMFMDADYFKLINDTYGHTMGDQVLIKLSERLLNCDPYGATMARIGGDEFAILFHGKYNHQEIESYAEKLTDLCSEPMQFDRLTLNIMMSIGISICPSDACDSATLMRYADAAMYHAKFQNHEKYTFYTSNLNVHAYNKNKIEGILGKAEIENDFELYYQPQFSIAARQIIGAEALIRWKSNRHKLIPPGEFIPLAEEIGHMIKIGNWVMNEAFRQVASWNKAYDLQLKMGVNISPKQLDDEFVNTLKNLLDQHFVDNSWIDIEIAEYVVLENEEKMERMFSLFKQLGLSVSIDHFGTGYSSQSYLKKYRVDRIKIDRSLIEPLLSSDSYRQIVKTVIAMSKSLGIKVLAAGVELAGELDMLAELGCDQIQGYLLGKPVPAAVFEKKFLRGEAPPDEEGMRQFEPAMSG